ncbi:F-box domain-containing protein [Meloidogyne graminicola]|uniref:F-box domain-containing protein n=1 Tax=Meloidogyne graminicola TaxID=189291 RepID=A0A8S9ZYA0_9BILA|nr:F-box domain-containing protein [Meloidogyne graminicola]
MIILPSEIWFDIFKLLNYNQLCNLRLTKHLFLLLIDQYKNNLALKQFYSLELDREGHDYMNSWLKAKDIYNDMLNNYGYGIDLFKPNNELIKKWNIALSERIPLFIPEMYTKLRTAEYNIIITIKEKDPYNQRLRLFLPHFPERIGQLIFIRYWLEQLSFCSFLLPFCYCDCYYAIFNPKILNLLFDNNNLFNFNSQIAGLYIAKNNLELNKQFIEFISKYLIITKCLYLCIGEQNYEEIIKLILNYGNKINKIRICYENIFEPSLIIETIIKVFFNFF